MHSSCIAGLVNMQLLTGATNPVVFLFDHMVCSRATGTHRWLARSSESQIANFDNPDLHGANVLIVRGRAIAAAPQPGKQAAHPLHSMPQSAGAGACNQSHFIAIPQVLAPVRGHLM